MKQRHLINFLIIIVIFFVSFPVQAIAQSPLTDLDENPLHSRDIRWTPQMSPLVEICSSRAYNTDASYNRKHDEYLVVCEYSNKITGRRVSSRGEVVGPGFDIWSFSSGAGKEPKIAYDDINDRYLIIWFFQQNQTDTDYVVYGRFIAWNGPSSANLPFQISEAHRSAVGDDHLGDLVFAYAAAKYLVVWANEVALNLTWIIGREIPADGSPMLKGSGMIAYDAANSLLNPSVAYNLARNEFLVVYDNGSNIYGMRLDSGNSQLGGGAFQIAGWPAIEYEPAVAACPTADQYLVAWHSINGPEEGVYARFVTGEGTPSTVLNLMHRNHNSATIDIDIDCGMTNLLYESPKYLVSWTQETTLTLDPRKNMARIVETNGSMSDSFVVREMMDMKTAVAGGKINFLVASQYSAFSPTGGHLAVEARIIGNTKPKAAFTVSPTQGGPNTNFKFDASSSSDNTDNDADLQVRWDWENDGIYDTNWTKDKIAYHKFNLLPGVIMGLFTVRLEVTDGHGAVDTTTRLVTVTTGSGLIFLPLILR